jgi:hypothetical protein
VDNPTQDYVLGYSEPSLRDSIWLGQFSDMVGSPARSESQDSNNECNQAWNTARAFTPIRWVLLALLGRRDKLELILCEHQIPNLTVCAQWSERLAVQSHFQAGRVANP